MNSEKFTISQFLLRFPTDEKCLEEIKKTRWPKGLIPCNKCNKETKHYKVTGRTAYACEFCGNHVYPLAGTVFDKTPTSLKLWFYAIYLMTQTRTGISAKQLRIDNVWSHLKRGITGVYRMVSAKYLQAYADEYAFRYNYRNLQGKMFDLLLIKFPN